MTTAKTWGPVLLKVADSLQHWGVDPTERSDIDIYWEIVFAAAHRHSTLDFHERRDGRLESVAEKLNRRLSSGWLEECDLRSPQAVFAKSSSIQAIGIQNPRADGEFADKPEGALWTSSLLPDGRSAWERVEASEFSHLDRHLWYFYFSGVDVEDVFHIRTILDYVQLISAHPRRASGGRVLVDWRSAACSYSAVHLTAAGLARAQNFRVETALGIAELRGWDAESTAWLRMPAHAELSPTLLK